MKNFELPEINKIKLNLIKFIKYLKEITSKFISKICPILLPIIKNSFEKIEMYFKKILLDIKNFDIRTVTFNDIKRRLWILIPPFLVITTIIFIRASKGSYTKVNAGITATTGDTEAMFVNVNPTFKVEFGSKENPGEQRVRFEVIPSKDNPFEEETTSEIKQNVIQKTTDSILGPMPLAIEMKLTKASIYDPKIESIQKDEETTTEVPSTNTPPQDESNLSETQQSILNDMQSQLDEIAKQNIQVQSNIDAIKQSVTNVVSESRSVYANTELIDLGRSFSSFDKDNRDPDNNDLTKKTVINREVVPGIDVEYQIIEGRGLKEEIVVKQLDSYDPTCVSKVDSNTTDISSVCSLPMNSYTFTISLDPDVRLNQSIGSTNRMPSGTYFFTDKHGRYLFHFLTPFAEDSGGSVTNNVKMQVKPLDKSEGGLVSYEIILTVDLDWMLSPNRQFPIRVDPSIVHDTEAEFDTGAALNRVATSGPNVLLVEQELYADDYTVGLWHVNETIENFCTDGDDVCDSSGNENNGTVTGTTIVDGLIGKGRDFNSASDYITVPSNPALSLSSEYTIETWVKPSSTAVNQRVVWKWVSGTGGYSITLGNFIPICTAANTASATRAASNTLSLNEWNHIACVYSSKYKSIDVYINGELNNGTLTGTAPASMTSSNTNLTISSTSNPFLGFIDEIRISNIARTPEEIKATAQKRPYGVYVSDTLDLTINTSAVGATIDDLQWTEYGVATGDGETPFSTTGLVAQWDFNETSGTAASNNFIASATMSDTSLIGGTVTDVEGYRIHTFLTSGTFTPVENMNVEYLIVGGGAGGSNGGNFGGGGGGGEVVTGSDTLAAGDFPVVVGAAVNSITAGNQSTFNSVVAAGGGNTTGINGGASGNNEFAGGTGYNSGAIGGGGGGGAGQAGQTAYETDHGGKGGDGEVSAITRANVTYGGGGGGAGTNIAGRQGVGGAGGGGEGGYNLAGHTNGTSGSPNTGGGGGGAVNATGGGGASGIVIVRYLLNDGALSNFSDTTTQDAIPSSGWTSSNRRWGEGALMFDGVDDFVSGGNSTALDLYSQITLESWVYPTYYNVSANPANVIISKTTKDSTNGNWMLLFSASKVSFTIYANNAYYNAANSTILPLYNWYHLVGTWDGSTMKLYVNGVNVASTALTGPIPSLAPDIQIGRLGLINYLYYFQGILDSTRIYSRALTSSEVLSNYNAGNVELQTRTSVDGTSWEAWKPVTGETQILSGDTSVSGWVWDNLATYMPKSLTNDTNTFLEGLGSFRLQFGAPQVDANTIALWHLDETNGDNAGDDIFDSTTNNNDGEIYGTNLATGVVDGIIGKARNFNGTDDYIEAGSALATAYPFTLSAWFKTSNTTAGDRIIFSLVDKDVENVKYAIGIDDTHHATIKASNTGIAGAYSTNTVNDGKWHHISGVFNSSTDKKLYLDGQFQASLTTSIASSTAVDRWCIGRYCDSSPNSYFPGAIDEVRVSNVARTSEEIEEEFRSGRDHKVTYTLSTADLSSKTKLPFWVASDRQGTFMEALIGESSFANYVSGSNIAGFWNMENTVYVTDSVITGGTITDVNGYRIHTFLTSGTFTTTESLNVEVLVVAGGGGGGSSAVGGGGGAGGMLTGNYAVPGLGAGYAVTIGGGGNGGGSASSVDGNPGGDSSIIGGDVSIISTGGGGGGSSLVGAEAGNNGGSGGGGGGGNSLGQITDHGLGTSGQGYDGGHGYGQASPYTSRASGGGGGAGGVGGNAASATAGTAGPGASSSITGSAVTYATGGAGAKYTNTNGAAGAANTGNGGGGGGYASATRRAGGNGGSGRVVIRYPIKSVKDSSINGNDGYFNSVIGQGKIGKGVVLNGTTDFIRIPASSALDLQTLTIDAWVYNAAFTTDQGMIFEKTADGTTNSQYSALFDSNNTFYFRTYSTAPAVDDLTLTTGNFFANNAWNHVACTYDGSSKKIYVNGMLAASKAYSQTLETNSAGTSMIGANGSGTGYFFNGIIDEVRISSVARTADEIRQVYEYGSRTHPITIDFVAKLYGDGTPTGATLDDALATGGTVSVYGAYVIHTFLTSGTFTPTESLNTEVLVVAGGGGGGKNGVGGGGGAGGIVYDADLAVTVGDKNVTVGLGGEGSADGATITSGGDSVFESLTAYGGGHGKSIGTGLGAENGGSGGGGAHTGGAATATRGAGGDAQYGGNGGSVGSCPDFTTAMQLGGGGGGAGGVTPASVSSGCSSYPGLGAPGRQFSISGTSTYYGGGGSGARRISGYGRTGGLGGGGTTYTDGTDGLGGGGGGGSDPGGDSGDGGSGVVIIRYAIGPAGSMDLIESNADTSFTINAMPYGAGQLGSGLFEGEKVVVKENINGVEYIAQGDVVSINQTTGAVDVDEWDATSSFPSGGFTPYATVFKWQREFFDITGSLSTQRDAITDITLRISDASLGANVWIDDFKSVSSYLTDPNATDNIASTPNRYIQYGAILSTTDNNVTPVFSSATTNYTPAPLIEEIMRHGKWFYKGIRQPSWWTTTKNFVE